MLLPFKEVTSKLFFHFLLKLFGKIINSDIPIDGTNAIKGSSKPFSIWLSKYFKFLLIYAVPYEDIGQP